jgi:hypothetical protein
MDYLKIKAWDGEEIREVQEMQFYDKLGVDVGMKDKPNLHKAWNDGTGIRLIRPTGIPSDNGKVIYEGDILEDGDKIIVAEYGEYELGNRYYMGWNIDPRKSYKIIGSMLGKGKRLL